MVKNKNSQKRISKTEIEDLFLASIENANSLLDIAIKNLESSNSHISLGLSEIALEEIGKSYTCLAYYSVSEVVDDWSTFWNEWRSHVVKAHRAFLYEFFCLVRMEIENSDKYIPSKRSLIPHEKEASFYVDFDETTRKAIIPSIEVEKEEIFNRVASVIGPLNAAMLVREKFKNKPEDYKRAFSEYAWFTLTHDIYQQDVLKVLKHVKNGNKDFDTAINDIIEMFTPPK